MEAQLDEILARRLKCSRHLAKSIIEDMRIAVGAEDGQEILVEPDGTIKAFRVGDYMPFA